DAKAFIFDMDGVLYRGKTPLPGVQDLFNALTVRGIRFLLATNNSMATPAAYVKRMADMGVDVSEADVQTSATATRDYLLGELKPDARILTVGMPALAEQIFTGTAFRPATDDTSEPVDAVVAGLDLEFTYDKLHRAMQAILDGARFVATNTDATLPIEGGVQPGAGSIVAAIATASQTQPVVVGKPETLMMIKGIELLGVTAGETVMVGDRLDTDILSGHRAGLRTALVLTGVSQRSDLETAEVLPDVIFTDLPAMTQAIVGHG
ncbi:MAG: HAD-IIA family hydrolase, partial [Chloroflexota bacterium]|nr:HAD-IIA family hydrolase [Chloroflexota bacterium]